MPVSPQRTSLFPVNFITGLSDGLVLPLAACIVALPFVAVRPWASTAAGLAVTVAGALVFGWARYAGEREEIAHKHPELGRDEAEKELALLRAIGIDDSLTADMKTEMEQERALWLREVKEHELGWEQYDARRAWRAAGHTAGGFLAGGILAALPFLFVNGSLLSVALPLCWVLLCLLLLGAAKGKLTGRPVLAAALSGLARGCVVMAVAGLIAWAVSGL